MKNTIYSIAITALFTACKQNVNDEVKTEELVVVTAIQLNTDSAIATISDPTETPKLKLPFIGKRWYSMDNPLAYGSGYSVIETKGDKKHTSNYYAGKFKEIIPCNYKGSEEFPPCYGFYKITSDNIYSVDAKGTILSDAMCCTEGIPEEEIKCKCQSKLSINNNQYKINNMKHTAYFFTIISLFIACKQNIKNEKTDEATVVTIQHQILTVLQQNRTKLRQQNNPKQKMNYGMSIGLNLPLLYNKKIKN